MARGNYVNLTIVYCLIFRGVCTLFNANIVVLTRLQAASFSAAVAKLKANS